MRGRTVHDFWLVQRIKASPWDDKAKAFYGREGVRVKSNPFGYGRLGGYELDYMGAAEFEFGAIPEANNRLAKAGKDLRVSVGEHNYGGRLLDFLYIGKEGDPFPTFCDWAEGGDRRRAFDGQERPWDFEKKLTEPDYQYGGDVWWALLANVQWAFHDGEDGHLLRMLASMSAGDPVEFLR